jgi:hypothetical protein
LAKSLYIICILGHQKRGLEANQAKVSRAAPRRAATQLGQVTKNMPKKLICEMDQ